MPRLPIASIVFGGVLELIVIAVLVTAAARALRRGASVDLEDAIEASIADIVPRAFGAFMVAESTAIVAAMCYLAGGFRRPPPPGYSYVRTWPLVPLLLAFPVMLLPEMIVVDIVLASSAVSVWWRVANDALHIYAVLWSIGLVAMARMRPHRVIDGVVRLRMGVLGKLDAALENIAVTTIRSQVRDPRALRRELGPGAAVLAFDGAPAVELVFHTPVALRSVFGRVRPVTRAIVAVDDPRAFAAALAFGA